MQVVQDESSTITPDVIIVSVMKFSMYLIKIHWYGQSIELFTVLFPFHHSVDATKETERLGRLINHSKNGNCQTKLHDINGIPHLILVASRDIEEGEELLYDYGDRSKASIAAHPWLKHWRISRREQLVS